MSSSEFLQALLSTVDKKYRQQFSLKALFLLKFTKLFFPKYLEIAAKSRLELKKDIIKNVKKLNPKTIIELGSGYSKDYSYILKKKEKRLIQVDRENLMNSSKTNYLFVNGDICQRKIWEELENLKLKNGVIIAEGFLSYLNKDKFDFVIENINKFVKRGFTFISHEPLGKISFSRRLISIFIGTTYRHFSSADELFNYYNKKNLDIIVIKKNKWQIIYKIQKN